MVQILTTVLVSAIAWLVLAGGAMAADDTTGPTIDTSSLKPTYVRGQNALAAFSCDDPSGVASCDAIVKLDTSTAGDHALTLHARDTLGNTSTVTVHYLVVVPPLTLQVTLGAPPRFAPFVVGLEQDYTASTTATLTASSAASSFSVVDLSANQPGHLTNGPFALPSALRLQAASAAGSSHGAGTVSATPLPLLDYTAPVTEDVATLTYTQHVGASDVLRTGTYAKTLTFTLTATAP